MLSAEETERAKEAMRHRAGCTGAVYAVFAAKRDGSSMLRCRGCERVVPMARLLSQSEDLGRPGPRFVLTCIWCEQDIRVDRPKPRIPLHPGCAQRRRAGSW